jgi:2-desacetyl-2-hydroxyethyl bacteriochlorophyllide A dehydrogenase
MIYQSTETGNLMNALQIHNPGDAGVVDRPVPDPGREEVLIKVMACGVCGTDIHIFRGEYFGEYPVIPGHEFAGVVEDTGAAVTRFRRGDRVAVEPNIACNNCESCLNNRQNFCLNWEAVGVTRPGGMAEYVLAPESNTFDVGDIPFEAAAFMEPLSCILHGFSKIRVEPGDRVALLGAGPIGLLMLQVAHHLGAVEVTVVDRNEERLRAAGGLKAHAVETDLSRLENDVYDVVIDATGAIPVMARTVDLARPGGTVLLFGVPPRGRSMELEPFTIFRKGLTLVSSYTSVRNSYQAIDLLRSGAVEAAPLVSHRLPLDQFRDGVETIESGTGKVKKVMMLPQG